jgi:hypothetical protein
MVLERELDAVDRGTTMMLEEEGVKSRWIAPRVFLAMG